MRLRSKTRILQVPVVLALFILAQVPFALAGQWDATGAPSDYDVVVRLPNPYQGPYPGIASRLAASPTPSPGILQLQPLFQQDVTPPITLRYNITVDGQPITSLAGSNVTIEFIAPNGDKIYSRAPSLSQDGEFYTTEADVPFEGDYNAIIDLNALLNDTTYEASFTSEFYSDSPSVALDMGSFVRDVFYTPLQGIPLYANMSFHGKALEGVNIFKAGILHSETDLIWDSAKKIYEGALEAPEEEGIYELTIYAIRQGYVDKRRIYVVDTAQTQGERCPITPGDASCNSLEELRRCVSEYMTASTFVSESQLSQCAEGAFQYTLKKEVICEDRKGDLDGDLRLDIDDAELFQETIIPLTQQNRQEYVQCADYDNDLDVDEDDLKCLVRVIGGKQFGDMNGGFCFDVETDSPLAGDLDGNRIIDADDNDNIRRIIEAAGFGIELPPEFLRVVDFNQDGKVDTDDQDCLKTFIGMRLDTDTPILPLPQVDIPPSCMQIYGLEQCAGIPGDLNGDLFIDEVDEILIMLTNARKIRYGTSPGQPRIACADVNRDNHITQEDVLCVKAYVDGDFQDYFVCRGCTEAIPPEYRAAVEICGDGWDNDCDGLLDRTSSEYEEDMCACSEITPCWMVKDGDGGATPGVDDGNVELCRDLGWDAVGYRWVPFSEIQCQLSLNCQTAACEGRSLKCSFDGTRAAWFASDALPPEDEDPDATPRRCEDSWDNDCIGGDAVCEDEEGQPWYRQVIAGTIMAATSFLMVTMLPPPVGFIAAALVGLGASQVFPEYQIGILVGGVVGGLAGGIVGAGSLAPGADAAQTAAQGAQTGAQAGAQTGQQAGTATGATGSAASGTLPTHSEMVQAGAKPSLGYDPNVGAVR